MLPLLELHIKARSRALAGMVLALQCVPRSAQVHLFGYNWTQERQFYLHRLAIEARYAAFMAAAGRATIHPSPCSRLRQCDPDPPPQVRALVRVVVSVSMSSSGRPIRGLLHENEQSRLPRSSLRWFSTGRLRRPFNTAQQLEQQMRSQMLKTVYALPMLRLCHNALLVCL